MLVHETVNGEKSMFHENNTPCFYVPQLGHALGQAKYTQRKMHSCSTCYYAFKKRPGP